MSKTYKQLNIFIDTEFSKLPWEKNSNLLSIGLYTEKGDSYYAVIDSIEQNEMSPFVKDNVLPFLIKEPNKKTRSQISNDIEELLNKYLELKFWAQFPTIDWLTKFGFGEDDAKEIFTKYADWDFQLFKRLWNVLPEKFNVKCSNLTTLINEIPQNSLPINNQQHHALADAKWNYEVWKIYNKFSK